jgi:iron complex transport system substrate-binding protein
MTTTLTRPAAGSDADTDARFDLRFQEIVDELTRRGFLAGGIGAAALIGLAACGSSSDNDTSAGTSRKPAATTRVVDTAKGKVTVPADPKRIVAISPQTRGTLYDLGVSPIGVYDEGQQYISPRYRDQMKQATTISSGGDLNLEKIASVQPDLIIGVDYSWNTDLYSKLSAVAPTVIAPSDTWQAIAKATAEAVGKTSGLTALEQRFASTATTIKSTYADVLGRLKWDILQGGFDKGKFWLYGPQSDAGAILAAAGVQFATASAGVPGVNNKALSYENIDVLADADVIGFYADYDNIPTNEGPQLFAQAGFKALAAVKAGRTVPIPDFLPNGYGDAIAVLNEVETGLKKLQEA